MKYVAWDVETELTEPGCLTPRLACLSFCQENKAPVLVDPGTGCTLLASWLTDPQITLVGHNVSYDLAVYAAEYEALLEPIFHALLGGRIRDTQIREQLIRIKEGNHHGRISLAELANKYLGMELKKGADSWQLRFGELMTKPIPTWPEEARNYATADAATTLRVFLAQGGDTVSPDEVHQMRAAWSLHLAACWGIRTDRARVEALKVGLELEYEAKARSLIPFGIFKVQGKKNPKVSKDTSVIKARVEAAYAIQGLAAPRTPPTERAPAGNIQYSEEVLIDSKDEALVPLAELGKTAKLLESFIPVLESGTEWPIQPRWNCLVDTGRTSCGDPNLQQLPRKGGVRECFVPRPGHLFLGADYDTAELRSLAQVLCDWFGQNSMADALIADRDLHVELACSLEGWDYAEAMERLKAEDPVVKERRQFAKIANFGFPGGLGAETFVAYAKNRGVHLTEAQAWETRNAYFERWPEMKRYFARIQDLTSDMGPGYITQHKSGRIRGRVNFTSAANSFFQGLTADGAKEALWQLTWKCHVEEKSALYGSHIVAFVHDEFLLEVPEENASAAGDALCRVMNAAMAKWIPSIPIKSSPYLTRAWNKDAKTVRDAQGQLIVWEPKPKTKEAA